MTGRVKSLFRVARDYAARRIPWLKRARVRFCKQADAAHRHRWRLFAHTEEDGVYTVCFARAAERELTDNEILGMVAHELGHVVGIVEGWPHHSRLKQGTETSKAVQDEADRIARKVLGFRNLRYNKRTLETL